MSHQNKFLLPHQHTLTSNAATITTAATKADNSSLINQENEFQVDTDFDSYWEEEARNPHRNRIRIGRQYQATVPQILKPGDKDSRKLEDLETLSFCPKRSAKVSNTELDHYFTVAKSLNLFASLVETRSLLGRDVTIADLNRIRRKEGLSLASVIQPNRTTTNHSSIVSPQSSQQTTAASEQKSSPDVSENASATSATDPAATITQDTTSQESYVPNYPLMKALSHFISLHHPCHHDTDCKKLSKETPIDTESVPSVASKTGNLRGQGSCPSSSKLSRFRPSTKQQSAANKIDEPECKESPTTESDQAISNTLTTHYDEWTRDEVRLFSEAVEICGKNFGSIKKEFLPSKSVRSIVEYYYIGSREVSDGKRKSNQSADHSEKCSSPDKSLTNNNGAGGGGGGDGSSGPGGYHSSTGKGPSNSNISELDGASSSTKRYTSSNSEPIDSSRSQAEGGDKQTSTSISITSSRQSKTETISNNKSKSEGIDARMSVYNFDDEIKDDSSPARLECPRPGAEVKPLKAKPILPNAPDGSEASNSNVGSLKFFMDGQLVLKLNACQEQQKCHWVQSGDKIPAPSKQKRYSKRSSDRMSDLSQNGSQSNSVLSFNQDEDSKTEDLTADEDSKESANSFTNIAPPRHKSQSASPSPKRSRVKAESISSPSQSQLASSIDYNRLAVNNRMKERNDSSNLSNNSPSNNNPTNKHVANNHLTNNHLNNSNLNNSNLVNSNLINSNLINSNLINSNLINSSLINNNVGNSSLSNNNLISNNPLMNQAAMPWLQANSFAMAAALLGGLPFPQATNNMVGSQVQNVIPNIVNLASRPMDLSVDQAPKPIQTTAKSASRSKSKQKNN